MINRVAVLLATVLSVSLYSSSGSAEWVNRYPKLTDFGHHIYLEQHALPILASGPTEPAPAPDGKGLAFAAQGWIWILNLEDGVARRLTSGAPVDSRPRWSADGSRLAFVRDSGDDTSIVVRDMKNGKETVINTPTIELDPEFSSDGAYLFYTSGVGGSLSLWRRHLASGTDEQLTNLAQIERNVRRLADGSGIIYLHANGAARSLRLRDFVGGEDKTVLQNGLDYRLTADVHPRERVIVFTSPTNGSYHLYTMDLDRPGPRSRLTDGHAYALSPSFSADAESVYYVQPDENQRFHLMRVPSFGGTPTRVAINAWDYGEALGSLRIETRGDNGEPVPARLSIKSKDGHPVASQHGATFYDSQTGRHFLYSNGSMNFELPAGSYEITAARGPMTIVANAKVRIRRGKEETTALTLKTLWSAADAGYVSVDQHVHLNGDGHQPATHDTLLTLLEGEDLDQVNPMAWNLWNRGVDQSLIGKRSERNGRTVDHSQEVRSDFHGHIGLARSSTQYRPWFYGPFNPRYGDVDQTNGDVFTFADREGAFATYVHPIPKDSDPFTDITNPIPTELIADGVLIDRLGLELVCAWTSPLGNSALWYRFLNIGKDMPAMSGTDSWADFHRTPAMGTARSYIREESGGRGYDHILDQAIAGRSFVTTGPALVFHIDDEARPGDVVSAGEHNWQVMLASTTPVDRIEIVVNGEVVETEPGVKGGKTITRSGSITLPAGGWVAARAYASEPAQDSWPTMAVRPFAHSSPIWIDEVGSTDPAAKSQAARDLLRALNLAERRAKAAYGATPMPKMQTRFDRAREVLEGFVIVDKPADAEELATR